MTNLSCHYYTSNIEAKLYNRQLEPRARKRVAALNGPPEGKRKARSGEQHCGPRRKSSIRTQ
jgi:hypothetical protein